MVQTFSNSHLLVAVALHLDGSSVNRRVLVDSGLHRRGDQDFKFIVGSQARRQVDVFTSWQHYMSQSSQVIILIQIGRATLKYTQFCLLQKFKTKTKLNCCDSNVKLNLSEIVLENLKLKNVESNGELQLNNQTA